MVADILAPGWTPVIRSLKDLDHWMAVDENWRRMSAKYRYLPMDYLATLRATYFGFESGALPPEIWWQADSAADELEKALTPPPPIVRRRGSYYGSTPDGW